MDRLYGGVCYAGIDTDPELKYPKGAGRVAFSNQQSYIAAISARFVQLQHGEIDKRVRAQKVGRFYARNFFTREILYARIFFTREILDARNFLRAKFCMRGMVFYARNFVCADFFYARNFLCAEFVLRADKFHHYPRELNCFNALKNLTILGA
jgi:hypothetical protein